MSKPKMKLEEVNKLTSPFLPVKGVVYLVGIRGYYKDSMGKKGVNDLGIYDDAMFVIAPKIFKSFNANTDPSKVVKGIATLIPGVHYFKKGKHKILSPSGYAAFRPATPDESLPVIREGKPDIHKGIAINIHMGGMFTTSSEGCQTIRKDQWKEFKELVYKLMDDYQQKEIAYILINL